MEVQTVLIQSKRKQEKWKNTEEANTSKCNLPVKKNSKSSLTLTLLKP